MKLVYENKLSCENDVKDFVLEGSAEIYFENGKMRMKNALSADLGQKSNFVYWCNEDFPSDVQITTATQERKCLNMMKTDFRYSVNLFRRTYKFITAQKSRALMALLFYEEKNEKIIVN